MKVSPLMGKSGFWLREFGDTAERTIDKILDTVTGLGGGNLLVAKCMDGMTWQGMIDAMTPINSIDDIHMMAMACDARGVTFCPVVVPRGGNTTDEGIAHAAIAQAAGVLMVDLEPYAGFYDKGPLSTIPDYCHALSVNAASSYLVCQPDPRPWAFQQVNIPAIAGYFDAFCPQHYVGWDSGTVHWLDVDEEVRRFEQFKALGRDMFVTLYGVDRTDLAAAFWERVKGDALGFHVFSLGPMDAQQLQFFATLPRPQQPAPVVIPEPVADPCSAVRQQLDVAKIDSWRNAVAIKVLSGDENGALADLQAMQAALQGGK